MGSFGAAWWLSGAVVAVFGVYGEGADEFTGGGVDDADVVAVDEQDDAGSVEGSAESDVVHLAVYAQAHAAGVDAIVADAVFSAGGVFVGGGFGSGGVRDGWCGVLWE